MSNRKGKQFAIGAVVGGVLGAVTALLFAPKSGRELRSDITEQYSNVSEKTQQIASSVGQKGQEIAKTVGSHTTEWVDKAKNIASNVAAEVKSWRESDPNESFEVIDVDAQEVETQKEKPLEFISK